ncbi:MAG: hypothetical protein R2700_16255 [Solirubrobacterales bacterium]
MWILLAVVVLVVIGVAYGLYTRKGSGISRHPLPDAWDPTVGDETKASGRNPPQPPPGVDPGESHELDQRGTR